MPEEAYSPAAGAAPRRRSRQPESQSRRDFGDDFASTLPDTSGPHEDNLESRRRKNGSRLRLNGRPLQVPKSTWGRVLSAFAFLIFLGVVAVVFAAVRSFFLHDPQFTVATSSAVQTTGNTHLSRAQLLSVFGDDVERNIFNIPLAARRAELESLPWVRHATVMRLLPNHLRVAITERTPIAFVRQGSQIGMVDASGVLLDMPPDAPSDEHYSFPVVSGISAADPLSTRAARMKIYAAFTGELDGTGNHISSKLSEVDLSDPEDVKALIPEGNADILVHFGDTDFLDRYQKFEAHLHEWLTEHPKLASVDMRYERQVVLDMQPGTTPAVVPTTAGVPGIGTASSTPKSASKPATAIVKQPNPATKIVSKPITDAAAKPPAKLLPSAKTPAPAKPAPTEVWHMVVVKPHTKAAADLAKARLAQTPQTGKQAAPQ